MSDLELRDRALARDKDALRALSARLAPVVHARVARALERWAASRGRTARRQEVEDMVQEVFATLFADDARALRAWDPARGATLAAYVGLIAEHQVAAILRSGRRNPWTEAPMIDPDAHVPPTTEDAPRVEARDLFTRVLDRLRAELTPKGLELFYSLMVHEQPVDEVVARTGMTPEAVWAWRSRLARRARELASELERPAAPAPARRLTAARGAP